VLDFQNTIVGMDLLQLVQDLKPIFSSIYLRDFRFHDIIVRDEGLMAQVFPYIDNKFKFTLNLRTLRYFEDYLNYKSVIKEINI
jgi:hypothetical protein